jgi:low temperature requirement protein LtrA
VDQDGPRLKNFQVSIAHLLAAMICIAIGITCLRLSFHRRFAGGSLPNVYLIVLGLALFVVIPTFSLCRRANWTPLANFVGSLALSILIVIAVLAFLVLSGTI